MNFDRYCLFKLLKMYSIWSLASLTSSSKKSGKVIINHINPGWVITNIMQEYQGLTFIVFRIARAIFARQTEVGFRTIMAGAEGGDETHGQYLHDYKPGE